MIPYAICRGTIQFDKNLNGCDTSLEIRLLELAPDMCTFRLPKSCTGFESRVKNIHFCFYQHDAENASVTLESDFQLQEKAQTRFWVEWELRTENPAFIEASKKLTREYMDYIYARLESEWPMGVKGSDFPKRSIENGTSLQKVVVGHEANVSSQRSGDGATGLSFGIALEHSSAYRKYLDTPLAQFLEDYWKSIDTSEFEISPMPIQFLEIGNSFCPLQGPTLEDLIAIIQKADQEGCQVIYTMAPVSELRLEETMEFMTELHRQTIGRNLEIKVGDSGMEEWLKRGRFSHFTVSRGILMQKKLCDARMHFLGEKQQRSCDISMKMQPENLVQGVNPEADLYLPYQQMNTGTFCPLYAAVTRGDRGQQERVTACPGYCEEQQFSYSEHLHMVGRYNSLFYVNTESLANQNILKTVMEQNGRIIWNF